MGHEMEKDDTPKEPHNKRNKIPMDKSDKQETYNRQNHYDRDQETRPSPELSMQHGDQRLDGRAFRTRNGYIATRFLVGSSK